MHDINSHTGEILHSDRSNTTFFRWQAKFCVKEWTYFVLFHTSNFTWFGISCHAYTKPETSNLTDFGILWLYQTHPASRIMVTFCIWKWTFHAKFQVIDRQSKFEHVLRFAWLLYYQTASRMPYIPTVLPCDGVVRNNLSELNVDKNAYLSIDERHCNPVEQKQSCTLSSVIVYFLHKHKSHYSTKVDIINTSSTDPSIFGYHK